LLEKIAVFGQACYKALSLKNSLGHLEVIVAKDGRIVPVEMGARSSGYIATHLVDFVSEQSFLKKYRDVLRGEKVKNGINFSRRMSSMYYFYDIYPGISKCSTNIMKYLPKEIETVAWDRDNLVSGKEFAVICADHERYGFEIIGGPREILTITEIENAERKFNQDFVGMEG